MTIGSRTYRQTTFQPDCDRPIREKVRCNGRSRQQATLQSCGARTIRPESPSSKFTICHSAVVGSSAAFKPVPAFVRVTYLPARAALNVIRSALLVKHA